MHSFNRSSEDSSYGKKFDLGSEPFKDRLIKHASNGGGMTGGIPMTLQRRLEHKKLWRTGILILLSIAALHYVYLSTPSPCKFKHSSSKEGTPILHFSSPTGTHNFPTGLFVDGNETWHIYLQTTPNPIRAKSCTSWGHAISSDLYRWSMQPIALQCDDYDILGGSTVVDNNNTSGLFPNQTNGVVAMYTQRHIVTGMQEQAIAYSTNGGYTFTIYSKKPSFLRPDESQEFRDPKVVWHESTARWVMTVAEPSSTAIGIYTSPNLIDWVAVSEYTNKDLVDAGEVFEYPSLVPIPRLNSTGARNKNHPTVPGGTVKDYGDYILVISSRSGSPLNGGSVTRYFPGKFNGTHFESLNNRTDRFIDFGPDNYATQFFFGLPHAAPVVGLGLESNLGYATSSLTPYYRLSQSSTFTGPRESYLVNGPGEGDLSLLSRPMDLDSLRVETLANFSGQQLPGHSVSYNPSEAVLVEIQFVMQPPNDGMIELNIDFVFASSKSPHQIFCTIVFRTWTADFGCDRSQAMSKWGIDKSRMNEMSARQIRPLLPFHNPAVRRWEVQTITDQSILEVFLNDGVKAGTMTTSSETIFDTIHFQSSKIPTWAVLSMNVQRLRPGRSARGRN